MPDAPAAQPLNLLLVDDRPGNLLALEEMLRAPDVQLFRAESGNDALRLLLKFEFALVLLDVEMPGMDGYETAQLMRSVEATRHVPIIFVTAGDRSEERTFRGYDAGAVDFLHKPINAHTLRCKVDVFLDLHRKTHELAVSNAALERTTAALRARIADLEDVNRTLSHDLRAPVRTIQAFSTALAEAVDGTLSEDAQDCLDRVRRAGDRMSRLLDGLFSLLRLSAADETFDEVDTSKVLAGVLDSLHGDLAATGAVVTHNPLPKLRSNAMLLGQILENLVANALKFRRDGHPEIHVTAESTSTAWRFAVRDNGIGIDAENRERVFTLFERVGATTAPGTGVGLTLCKRAVEKLHGEIWVDSVPGRGSTFYFTVPRG